MKKSPPKRALQFLRWFCREDYVEEIEGDLTEIFEKQYEVSPRAARLRFALNVIRYFRPAFMKSFKFFNPFAMGVLLRHNLILSLRSFMRYRMSFFINLCSLSVGLACALLIYLWVGDELSVDKFHEKDRNLYQVMYNQELANGIVTNGKTPGLLAAELAAEFPEIEYATTATWVEPRTLSVRDDYAIKAGGRYVSKDFFNTFTHPLLEGDKDHVIDDVSSIVLSESLCMRLFNTTTDVIGKQVVLDHEAPYQVTGIFKDVPPNSSWKFDFVMAYERFEKENDWARDWNSVGPYTYIVTREGVDIDLLNKKIVDFATPHRKEGKEISLFLARYSDNYLYGHYENGRATGGRIDYVILFSIIAVFILVIACINFMNLSTARATRRLKEIGVKKTLGASRKALAFQYLTEAILVSFFSLLVAVALVWALLPSFNVLTGKDMSLRFDPSAVLAVLGVTLLTGIFAGSYPALYLSGFNPVAVLKGKLRISVGEALARKGLVVFQFAISVVLIASVLIVFRQTQYVQNRNIGYDRDNLIFFLKEGRALTNPEALITEMKKIPGVINAAGLGHNLLAHTMGTEDVHWEGKMPGDEILFEYMFADYGMIETLGLEMKEGRAFSRDFVGDTTAVIFNETAIEYMGLSDPVGRIIMESGQPLQIIGVVKDFNFTSLHDGVKPLFVKLWPRYAWNIVARIDGSRQRETLRAIEDLYKSFNPGFVMDYKFLDQEYQALYAAEQRVSTLSRYFAGIAILISSMGLFGVASFTAERRMKEIGIRKILGSTSWGIVVLLTSDFTKMVLVAVAIALPVSYIISDRWLDSFAYRIKLEWWYFAVAGVAALLIAWFTVGLQTVKAAAVSMTRCLRMNE
ncbi:MAG TPA: ABC transporter permease [Cyclobacteriaceae bacterium]|jgi:ABC-type antimicrobial peptide transport system permease subunit